MVEIYTARLYGWSKFTGVPKPEARLSINVADLLRAMVLDGTLKAVFTHIPNEGKRTAVTNSLLRACGMISGAPDYMIATKGGVVFIELKAPKKKPKDIISLLSDKQKDFRLECIRLGIPYYICTSTDEVKQALIDNNLI